MSQDVFSSINPSTTSGTQLAAILDDFKDAVMSGLSGTSRPPQTTAGGYWVDTTNEGSPNFYWKFMLYTGSVDVEVFRINLSTGKASISGTDSTFEVSRTSADQVGALFTFLKSRVANNGQVLDGDEIGELRFSVKNDDGDTMVVATMRAIASDDATDAAAGAYLVWETTPDGTASAAEHMRLINGRLGIGTQAPETQLHVAGSLGIRSDYTADSANGAQLSLQKGRSSGDGSTQNNDVIGDFNFRTTDDATAKSTSARLRASATQAHTSTAQGTKLEVQTAETGTATPTTKITIGPDDVEANFPLKVNAQQLIIQDVATSATINQLSAAKTIVRFTGSTATSVRGLNSGHASKTVVLHNASSADVTIEHENTNASANDRITLPDSSPVTISANSSVELFYSPTDTRWKLKSGSGTGSGGGSGGKNYLAVLYSGKATTGISTYDDGAVAVPVDGTGGSPSAISAAAINTSSPLRSPSNLRLSKTAANAQGEGWNLGDIVMDPADYEGGKPVMLQFTYKTSANYANGDVRFFVYDKDAATVLNTFSLQANDGSLPLSGSSRLFTAVFYPNSTSNDYRILAHVTSTNATAWDIDIIDLAVSPRLTVPGAIQADFGTETWTDNQANATTSVKLTRIGNMVFADGVTSYTGAQSGAFSITIPAAYTPDAGRYPITGSELHVLGSVEMFDASGGTSAGSMVLSAANTATIFYYNAGAATFIEANISATVPWTWASGDRINWRANWVVSGWATTAALSTAETMLQSAKFSAVKTSTQAIASSSPVKLVWGTVTKDNLGAWDSTNNRYVIKRAGRYIVSTGVVLGSAAPESYAYHIYVNGSSVRPNYITAANPSIPLNATLDLNAGDYVETFIDSAADTSFDVTNDSYTFFTITESPDLTVFSTYGTFEILNTTSSVKTPTASGRFHALTGNSLTLSPGTWRLTGGILADSSGSAGHSQMGGGFYGANGADSATVPTLLSATPGVTLLSTALQDLFSLDNYSYISGGSIMTLPPIVIRVVQPVTIYAVSYGVMTTAANARYSSQFTAERIQ